MKFCPVCKIAYSDNAEYCKKCEAYLQPKQESPQPVKTDAGRLVKMCLYTGAFIVFIMLLYYLLGMLIK